MVFSDSVNNAGLVEDVDFLCGTSSVSYPTSDKARNMNRHYYKAIAAILKSAGRAQFDDLNLASLPEITATMTANTHEVALNITAGLAAAMKFDAWEVQDASGNWYRLQELDKADMTVTITDFMKTPGLPKYYDLTGNYIKLYPAPAAASVTLVNGLKAHVQREVDAFTAADTTQEPGFAEPFHRILSLGASHDFLLVNGPTDKMDRVFQEYGQMLTDLKDFYSDRNREVTANARPSTRTSDYI